MLIFRRSLLIELKEHLNDPLSLTEDQAMHFMSDTLFWDLRPEILSQDTPVTRVVVTIHPNNYTPYIRYAPNWEQGTSLTCVDPSSGTWIWESPSSENVEYKITCNDRLWEGGSNHTLSSTQQVIMKNPLFESSTA